jgi:hypothetical protein
VTEISWGRVEVEGVEQPFRDVKLFPGGAREWDWTETGTHHRPGVQPTDLEELLDRGATTIVLSSGMLKQLRVPSATREWLERHGVELFVLATDEAVDRYNQLRETVAVGALIHSTC